MLYLDTANLEDIKKISKLTNLNGITTNPKIFAQTSKEKNIEEVIHQILSVAKVPLSIELTKTEAIDSDLVQEALTYYNIDPEHVVIKMPMWGSGRGLELAKTLMQEDVKINLTCLMDVEQAILGCELGVEYVSLFYNRIIDFQKQFCDVLHKLNEKEPTAREEAMKVIANTRRVIEENDYKSKIIAGSIRKPQDVVECLVSGAHIVTVTPKVFMEMISHSKTEETIREFDRSFKNWMEK